MALIDQQAAQAVAFTRAIEGIGNASKSTGQDLQDLSGRVLTLGGALGSWTVVAAGKALFNHAREALKTYRDSYAAETANYAAQKGALLQLGARYNMLKQSGKASVNELAVAKETVQAQAHAVAGLMAEMRVRDRLKSLHDATWVTSKLNLAVFTATAAAWAATVSSAADFNRAMVQASTNYQTRYDLVNRTLAVQAELGASTDSMAESVQALVEYGQDLKGTFSANLKTVVMLRDGLGVSAHTAAQLAVIFSEQLHTSAEKVGDVIAQIAANTALSAVKMADLAVETARVLRLLGPGMRVESEAVLARMGKLAGYMQSVGGNPDEIMRVYQRLSGGSDAAFALRGMAGIRPGQLGTGAGTDEAMRGVSRVIARMLPDPRNQEQYAAMLEIAAERTGLATYEIENFQKAVEHLNDPLSESKKLADAYAAQQRLLGDSFRMIKESVMALIKQALTPWLRWFNPMLAELTTLLKSLASYEPLVDVLVVAIPVAAVLAVSALARLSWEITKLAFASAAGSRIMGGFIPGGARMIEALKGLPRWWSLARTSGALGPGMLGPTFNAWQGSSMALGGGAVGALGTGAALTGALVGGYAVGRVLDRQMDRLTTTQQLLLGPLTGGLSWLKLIASNTSTLARTALAKRDVTYSLRHTAMQSAINARDEAALALAHYFVTGKGDPTKALDLALAKGKPLTGYSGMLNGLTEQTKLAIVNEVRRVQMVGPTTKTEADEMGHREKSLKWMEASLATLQKQIEVLAHVKDYSKVTAEQMRVNGEAARDAEAANAWNQMDQLFYGDPYPYDR